MPSRPSGRVKSAEFITNSDEDEMSNTSSSKEQKAASPKVHVQTTSVSNKNPSRDNVHSLKVSRKGMETVKNAPKVSNPTHEIKSVVRSAAANGTMPREKSSSNGVGLKPLPSDTGSVAREKSHKRNTSSPIKPSPLGSSPPTNASDLESSTPIKLPKRARPEITETKHSRAGTPASSRPVKRKAADISHPSTTLASSSSDDLPRPIKRVHQQSSTNSSDSTDTPPSRLRLRADALPLKVPYTTLDLAHSAMVEQVAYDRLLAELQTMDDPPESEMRRLFAMNERLVELSAKIYRSVGLNVPGDDTGSGKDRSTTSG